MIRVFLGFSFITFMFLSTLSDSTNYYNYRYSLRPLASMLHLPHGLVNLIVAGIVVTVFLSVGRLRNRLLSPTPGINLLTIGAVVFAAPSLYGAFVLGSPIRGTEWFAWDLFWNTFDPTMAIGSLAHLVLPIAKCLLLVGAIRLLTNLAPKETEQTNGAGSLTSNKTIEPTR